MLRATERTRCPCSRFYEPLTAPLIRSSSGASSPDGLTGTSPWKRACPLTLIPIHRHAPVHMHTHTGTYTHTYWCAPGWGVLSLWYLLYGSSTHAWMGKGGWDAPLSLPSSFLTPRASSSRRKRSIYLSISLAARDLSTWTQHIAPSLSLSVYICVCGCVYKWMRVHCRERKNL